MAVAPSKVPQLFRERSDLVRSLIKHTSSPILHVPAYNFKTRNVVFKIYQAFLLNRDVLLTQLDNPSTYISAVLGGIDEEKDPRNLLITYDILYFMLREYASDMHNKANIELIKPFLDEIFDKISCYFPINFVPPKNDKYQITPEVLKDKLARCFLASPLLAQSAIPFVLDKFKATQIDTKKECLGLLRQMFGPEGYAQQDNSMYLQVLEKHVAAALNLLSSEYFNTFDEACQKEIAQTLAVIFKRQSDYYISKGLSISQDASKMKTNIDDLLERCAAEIDESPESVTAFLATDLIATIVAQTNLSEYVLRSFLLERIIDPLIEADHVMSEHEHERVKEASR